MDLTQIGIGAAVVVGVVELLVRSGRIGRERAQRAAFAVGAVVTAIGTALVGYGETGEIPAALTAGLTYLATVVAAFGSYEFPFKHLLRALAGPPATAPRG